MYKITIKVFNRHFDGDNSYHIETIYVNGSQLNNWLNRGDTNDIKIMSWSRA